MNATDPPSVGRGGPPVQVRSEPDIGQDAVGRTGADAAAVFSGVLKQAGSNGGDAARVQLPVVARSVEEMTPTQRKASAELVEQAKNLEAGIARGAPASELSDAASALFDKIQGSLLEPAHAAEIGKAVLPKALEALHASPAYAQGTVIPREQSEAEGKMLQTINLVELGVHASRT